MKLVIRKLSIIIYRAPISNKDGFGWKKRLCVL